MFDFESMSLTEGQTWANRLWNLILFLLPVARQVPYPGNPAALVYEGYQQQVEIVAGSSLATEIW